MQVQTQHSLQGTISRPYSVLPSLGWATDPASQHHLDCLVKVQQNGRMSTHLAALPIGAILKVRGPFGRPFTLSDATKLNLLVAAGSGITPMLQWLHFLFSSSSGGGGDGQTSEAKVAWVAGPAVALLYVNRAEDDIMAKVQV
jgi:ferredoxin-NADP reductase